MGGSPGDVSEEACDVGEAKEGLENEQSVGEATEGLENEL